MVNTCGYLLGYLQTPNLPWARQPHKVSTHIPLGHQYSVLASDGPPVATHLTNTVQVPALCPSSVILWRLRKETSLPSWSLHSGGEGRKRTSEFQVVTRNDLVSQCLSVWTGLHPDTSAVSAVSVAQRCHRSWMESREPLHVKHLSL